MGPVLFCSNGQNMNGMNQLGTRRMVALLPVFDTRQLGFNAPSRWLFVSMILILSACAPQEDSQETTPEADSIPQHADGGFSGGDSLDDAAQDFATASELVSEARYKEALPILQKVVHVDSENEEVHYRLGYCLSRLNRPKDAIHHYQRTVEIFPEYAEAHNNLGNIFMKQRNYSQALPHFQQAIQYAPELASAHNNLGSLLSRQAKINEAVPHFSEALKIDPGYVEAYTNLGNAYLTQGRAEEATLEFSSALQLQPGFTPAVKGLQRARIRLNQLQLP